MPLVEAASDSGDFPFLAGAGSALLVRRVGAASPVRLLQAGDEAPGVPHSRVDAFSAIRSNASGTMAVQLDYYAGDTTKSGLFTCTVASFTKVALATDVAPGSGGLVFGRPTTLVGLNDAGALAFTAPLTPPGSPLGTPAQTTIYVAPPGGSPQRVAGPGTRPRARGGRWARSSRSVSTTSARWCSRRP